MNDYEIYQNGTPIPIVNNYLIRDEKSSFAGAKRIQ